MSTITEDFVSFEVAQLLKKKGFNEPCYMYYDNKGDISGKYINPDIPFNYSSVPYYLCPSQSMVMKWLRQVYNICVTIYPDKENRYEAVLYNIKDDVEIILQSFGIYGSHIFEDSYEEAVEAALKYSLENLI